MKRLILIISIVLTYFFLAFVTNMNITYIILCSSGIPIQENSHFFYSVLSYPTGLGYNLTDTIIKWDRIFACIVALSTLIYFLVNCFKSSKDATKRNIKQLLLAATIILIYFLLAIITEKNIANECSSGQPFSLSSNLFFDTFLYYDNALEFFDERVTVWKWDHIFAIVVSATLIYYSVRSYNTKKEAQSKLPL